MTPTEYQTLAARTECDQFLARERMGGNCMGSDHLLDPDLIPIRLNHAVLGLAGEVGELSRLVTRWLYYGQAAPTPTDLADEVGDILWFVAQVCNVAGLDMSAVMAANIEKLRVRHPSKFTPQTSAQENRDQEAEHQSVHSYVTNHRLESEPWHEIPPEGED